MDPQLTDVPETMLWTLHNRATEAMRDDAMLRDPDAVRIYKAISYDYERSFGPGEPSHAVRSSAFDAQVRDFVGNHPDGVVVNLGEGLETQRYRIDGDDVLWICVDVPSAIEIRERYIQADDRHVHLALSALDVSWMDAVPEGRPIFITAQGLFMYFEPNDVRDLFRAIQDRLPGAWLMFDSIPKWLSAKTTAPGGWKKTEHYTTPQMPWGINRNELEPTLREWVPELAEVTERDWRFPRGVTRWAFPIFTRLPVLGRHAPALNLVRFGSS